MNLYLAYYDMDEGCVWAWLMDGHIITIDCTKVEREVADNLYERSELDYLIYNDPAAYADLILNRNPVSYLKAITQYRTDDTLK